MEKKITLVLSKETRSFYKFGFADDDSISNIYLRKELFSVKPDKIEITINAL